MRHNGWRLTVMWTCVTTLFLVSHSLAQSGKSAPISRSGPPANAGSGAASPALPKTRRILSQPNPDDAARTSSPKAEGREPEKVSHLRRAAQHLRAAGKPELAERVAQEALLEEKLEQIRQLQDEVQRLRAMAITEQTVIVQLKVMELRVTKMRELGFDFQFAGGSGLERITVDTTVELAAFNGLIDALRQHDLVKVLAEPTLAATSGRPAVFQSGGEFPIVVPQNRGQHAVEYRQYGTRVDCVARVLDSGRIRLELRPTVSEIDTSLSVMMQGTPVPGLRTRSVDTAVEMEAGQTLVLSGMTQSASKHTKGPDGVNETALLVVVTVSLGDLTPQPGN